MVKTDRTLVDGSYWLLLEGENWEMAIFRTSTVFPLIKLFLLQKERDESIVWWGRILGWGEIFTVGSNKCLLIQDFSFFVWVGCQHEVRFDKTCQTTSRRREHRNGAKFQISLQNKGIYKSTMKHNKWFLSFFQDKVRGFPVSIFIRVSGCPIPSFKRKMLSSVLC